MRTDVTAARSFMASHARLLDVQRFDIESLARTRVRDALRELGGLIG
jgi:hypothetical protein